MAKRKSLSISAQTKHDISRIVLLTMAVYAVMLIVVYSGGGSNQCVSGQQVGEVCEIGFPFIVTLLFPAAVCGGAIFTLLTHSKHKKGRKK